LGLAYVQVARPGHRMPHAWLDRHGQRIDTHSLLRPGAFLCLAGADGQVWVDAANEIAAKHDVPIVALRVGQELLDSDGAWTRLRGHGDQGVVIVRPDGFVAARMPTHADDPAAWLDSALRVALACSRLSIHEY
jgi:2,4-dichlorophenol 6-monooxygenase